MLQIYLVAFRKINKIKKYLLLGFGSFLCISGSCPSSDQQGFTSPGTDRGGLWVVRCESDCSECYEYNQLNGKKGRKFVSKDDGPVKDCIDKMPDPATTVVDKWCEDDCSKCYKKYADGHVVEVVAPHWMIDDCIEEMKGGGKPCDDELDQTNYVTMEPADVADNKYGFDSWRDMKCMGGTKYLFENQNISYVSLKTSSSTKIKITCNAKAYDRYEARIVNETGATVGFSMGGANKVKILSGPGVTDLVEIFSSTSSGDAEIEVWGITTLGTDEKSTCLVGERGKKDGGGDEIDAYIAAADRLIVKVYDNYLFPTDYHVYLVEVQSGFNPSATDWTNEFNKVLKQAVAEIQPSKVTVTNWTYSDNGWDLNENGVFDNIIGAGLTDDLQAPGGLQMVPETQTMILQAGDGGCILNNLQSQFIVKGEIRTHWVLKEDYDKDDDDHNLELTLYRTDFLNSLTAYNFRIVEYYDKDMSATGHYENVKITYVNPDPTYTTIGIQLNPGGGPLTKNYLASDGITLYCDYVYKGLTDVNTFTEVIPSSCSFCRDVNDYTLFIHEFLHQALSKWYRHVGRPATVEANYPPYEGNIMYFTDPLGTSLRYRELFVPVSEPMNDPYSQWERIRGPIPTP